MTEKPTDDARGGGVQSVVRSVQLLDALADAGGRMTHLELSTATGLPGATVHRLLQTLLQVGLVRQTPTREYALGPRLVTLGEAATMGFDVWAMPHLRRLVDEVGETANLAMFDRDAIVYVAQVPSSHSMRMFTEVGKRVETHCTGVGKAMLAQMTDADVVAIARRAGLSRKTDRTLTTEEDLLSALGEIRRDGYAVDDGEQELGVRCIAMPLPHTGRRFAVSVSGPAARVTADRDADIVPALRRAAAAIAAELTRYDA
ncbi:MAG: IclR family transcriptional regulator [Promicromonosporaceae bacterium]|nr:IclR family transcriptional regulator [Promicromonosporaceae bacterium]